MDELYAEVPDNLYVSVIINTAQDIDLQYLECKNNEAWSFVTNKNNKLLIEVAMHRQSPKIVGLFTGDRGTNGAEGLWNSIPKNIRNNGVFTPMIRMITKRHQIAICYFIAMYNLNLSLLCIRLPTIKLLDELQY